MNVRKAEKKDIPRILELLVQVDMVHHKGRPDLFKGPATKYNAEELEQILRDEKTPVFVCADEEGAVLGHCFCVFQQVIGHNILTDVKTLYIDDLCVDEAVRGRHIGSALFRFVRDYARSIACQDVTLNVWAGNDAAMRFYQSMGMLIRAERLELSV